MTKGVQQLDDDVAVRAAPMRFVVVDLETSGLSVDRDRVLQIALVTTEINPSTWTSRVVDTWSADIRLGHPFQHLGPRHVHGLGRWRLLRGTPLRDAIDAIAARLDGAVFTAHNAAFDAGFLLHAAASVGVDLELGPVLCTLRLSRRLDPERASSHRLGDLCTRYAVTLDRPHDAGADAAATAAILPHLLEAHRITEPAHLTPFYVDVPSR